MVPEGSGGSAVSGDGGTARDVEGGGQESVAGYSRGVRRAGRVAVSGTTARGDAARADTYGQTVDCIRRVVASAERLGARRDGIVRTRVYLAPGADWEQASAAHRDLLGDVAPANTMLYVGALIGDGLLVEVEADAEVEGDAGRAP